MTELTLFYSWQSDLPRRLSRDLIRDATKDATLRIARATSLDEAPRLDHDTKGHAGTPDIAGTIFGKISRCALFLADVSFVGATSATEGNAAKKLSNPNVLLELGFAAATIGWDRVILVMNAAFGSPEELIFDLRNRRHPITFVCDSASDAATTRKHLSARIEEAVRAGLQQGHEQVQKAVARLDPDSLHWMKQACLREAFSVATKRSMGNILGTQGLVRLIDLGLLHCEIGAEGTDHAYRWTHLGKLVLVHLGLRPAAGSSAA